jgi:hypothetical protein
MRLLTGLALIACTAACSGAPTAGAADPAAAVAAMLQGRFDNVGQAGSDVDQRTVQLTVVPVLEGRDDGHWLYVEQAMTLKPDKPYGQRVYRVHEGADGEVLAELFSIEKPHRFVQGWQGGKLAQLQHDALHPLAGCTLHLRAEGDSWRGGTEGKACESKRGGASYATTEVSIDAKGVRAWERGFDASGKEVWGAKAPYVFTKRAETP